MLTIAKAGTGGGAKYGVDGGRPEEGGGGGCGGGQPVQQELAAPIDGSC